MQEDAPRTRTGRTVGLGLRMKPDTKAALDRAAVDEGISATAWVERAVRERLAAFGYLPGPLPRPAPAAQPLQEAEDATP